MTTETKKAMEDAKTFGVGIFDQESKKRVNPEALIFFWNVGRVDNKLQKEVVLQRNFAVIKNVYKKKFGDDSPYDLKLFKKDPGLFIERLIRSVEICTMGYVLNDGKGSLNINERPSIIKGRRSFLWEN